MEDKKIIELLEGIRDKKVDILDGFDRLKNLDYEDLGFAKVDHHRAIRKGFPEVVYCKGKTKDQVVGIIKKLVNRNDKVLATRASLEMYKAVKKFCKTAKFNKISKTIIIDNDSKIKSVGKILIMTAGTSDMPVAEEAYETVSIMGHKVEKLYDVGVAGIHRLLSNKKMLDESSVIIVIAGMDGALPAVVSGVVDKPVIAVPTSVGYGASFQGIGPLLTMLNSCSPGVSVINIDNGFGAGYFAGLINK
tara:strand:- start:38388 stop:39131 length:744 start_codon:yes stop_codon:yes gene_type:complete